MPQAIALSPGSLLGQGVIATNATPLMGYINTYNAALGPLSPMLRQASLGTLGTTCLVKKDPNDLSTNAITITCYPGEQFSDDTTTRELIDPGSFLVLALMAIAGVAQWEVVGSGNSGVPSLGGQILTFDGGGASTSYDGALTFDGGSASTTEFSSTFDGGGASTSSRQGLYIAPDGSLHYLGPTTDTQLAPA